MKYFLDTEFIEKPNTIELISIGLVCEDGRKLYLISEEYTYHEASDWVRKNVILPMYLETVNGDNRNRFDTVNFQHHYGFSKKIIKEKILEFIGNDKPEFWAYYADYDWVVFCWLFGSMIDLPKNFPMYCRDLKQLADSLNKPKFTSPKGEHNALADAIWNEKFYNYLLTS